MAGQILISSAHGRVPWTWRDMLLAIGLALGLMGAAAGSLWGAMLAWRWLGWPAWPTSARALAVLALEGLLIVPAWLFGPHKYGGGWAVLGLRRCSLSALLLAVWALGVSLFINVAWGLARQRLGMEGQPDLLPFFGGGGAGLFAALAGGAVIAPLAEEVLFRGHLYAGLRDWLGRGWGMIVSALLFALLHAVPGVMPPLFVLGLLLAWLYERSGSLWPSIGLHAMINAMSLILMFLVERFSPIAP